MRKIFTLSLLIGAAFSANAQQNPVENTAARQPVIRQKQVTDSIARVRLHQVARQKGWTIRGTGPDGRIYELQKTDERGFPVYYITDNLDAAKTLSTNKVWQGGSLGLSLNGDSMVIGEWDGGAVRRTHQELTNRVTQADGASIVNDHATHVAGTLIATGVEADAKGMANHATLLAHDWTSDETEMDQAASNGLLISNHSYGLVAAWFNDANENRLKWFGDTSLSGTESWQFGFYNQQAAAWDQVAFDNPNYLIVKSSGNDRGANKPQDSVYHWVFDNSIFDWVQSTTIRPNVGPYDCISGAGNSKNTLTVGAVNAIPAGYSQSSDVVMSSFSSWGPTDDGRIKPDVVGNGVGVRSSVATSNTAYDTYNGTSMATPNVTGSLILVQQHYKRLKGTSMRAATLKGLAIHTADEAGIHPGPDYSFGWGLVNTASAVQHISNATNSNRLEERTLNNGATYQFNVYSDGTQPLKATISWTDMPGNTPFPALDPDTKMLVNDLDIQIIRINDNTVSQPWVLDKDNPSVAATTGDNSVDNVEQVFIQAPQSGFYTVKISHKSTLFNSQAQAYSLLLSGEAEGIESRFTVNDATACVGVPVNFSQQVLGNPTTYKWYFEGGSPATSSAANPTVSYAIPGTYYVALKASNPATSDSLIKAGYITVSALPAITITPFTGNLCSNAPAADLTGNTSPAGGVFSGTGITANGFNAGIAGAGIHHIKYTYLNNATGCSGTDSLSITVIQAPAVPVITRNGDTLATNATGIYKWYDQNGAISGAASDTFVPPATGTYRVTVSDGTCEETSLPFAFIKTTVEHATTATIGLYPNPAVTSVTITAPELQGTNRVSLINAAGAAVLTREFAAGETMEISLRGLAKGFYVVSLQNNGASYFEKLLVK